MERPVRKPRRRWLRFSLRTLLLTMAVVAVALAWAIHKAREQAISVAALQRMGCRVDHDDINAPAPLTPLEWLRGLLGDEALSGSVVIAEDSQMTDAGLAYVARLAKLHQLSLTDIEVTDAGMVHLEGLAELDVLYL